ncbi:MULTISPECIES: MBL fold metallo-hydrolase [Schaalia]|uniref:MBL fold metallo-hydrolase n=1 Tax=Schaalia TaxID=2529408 RepID=UPI0012B23C80|nr:MBL fold metallo-hydrolase [Schaalia hyovaginalis]MCI6556109.1 MBL fold metallo-hydrolase [Schaalia hyovaginalis]MCI7513070.1 MBL fold metallo-hydrolase [Schaalia hyovaginalis]MDY4492773.1 MBL fold metallo-hydrolase [Schaalia hyovaginalis]MDY5600839.1 MBL fold metallo-hydrolase [Schaalia hyovaginalis]MST64555.1 MBL fold metallo-hydrolase [Schaalia hyovaginalis]
MRISVIPTPYYGANCVVIVPDEGADALVVDPSWGVTDRIREVLDRTGSRVGAVLATHGHPDHVWQCREVASWAIEERGCEAPVFIPGPDRYRMQDPAAHVPLPVPEEAGEWIAPADLRDVPGGAFEAVAGVRLLMVPAPGHTEGSSVFLGEARWSVDSGGVEVAAADEPAPFALSADVIFAGSVGRTDLPGGDEQAMRHSLRTLANALDPATLLIPGHGALTTMAGELESNAYLRRARMIG